MRYSCEGVCSAVPFFRRCRSVRPNCEAGNGDDEMPTLSTEKTMTVAIYICSFPAALHNAWLSAFSQERG